MAWSTRATWLLVLTGCLGDPQLVDCSEQPDHPGCAGTSEGTSTGTTAPSSSSGTLSDTDDSDTEDDTSTGDGELPPAGICYREPSPVKAMMEDGDFVVRNDLFEMILAEDENFMPSRLAAIEAIQQNLLYTGMAVDERLIGVELSPVSHSWDASAGKQTQPLAWETDGAVVRFSVEWEAPDNTPAWIRSHNPLRYTITPDGRMTRLESVVIEGTPEVGHWLTSYIALAREHFDGVSVRGPDIDENYDLSTQGMLYPDAMPEDDENLDPVLICAYDNDTGIAVGIGTLPWPSPSDDGTHPPDPKNPESYAWGLRASHPAPGESIGLHLDWGRDFTPVAETAYHTHMMQMVTVAPGDPCGCMHEQFRAYVEPPPLIVMGGDLVHEIEETQEGENDSQMDGYFSDGGYYGIAVDDSPFTVKTEDIALPTVLLRIVGVGEVSADGFEATLGGDELDEGVDYLATPSNDPAQGFYFFLARELPPDALLRIEFDG
jgi:hypothetical protein